jgi:hypothetical protein
MKSQHQVMTPAMKVAVEEVKVGEGMDEQGEAQASRIIVATTARDLDAGTQTARRINLLNLLRQLLR